MKPDDPEDPEQYIRDLERGVSETPGAAPPPSGADSGSPIGGQAPEPGELFRRPWPGVANLAKTPRRRRLLSICAVVAVVAIGLFVATHNNKDKVHGNLIMINGGAKDTIDCNNGSLKLDGDNNTYTVTGNCLRLEIMGSANKVTVDSADTISVIGDDNAVIYHSGAPTINKTGSNNIVAQRQINR